MASRKALVIIAGEIQELPSTDVLATSWIGLTDTPATVTANQFVRGDGGGTALVFFDLLNTANTWGADQTFAGNILPSGTRSVGATATLWNQVHASQGRFVGISGTGSPAVTQSGSGIVAGLAIEDVGATAIFGQGGIGNFRSPFVAGTSLSTGTATSTLQAALGGGIAIGTAYTNNAFDATLESTAYGAFVGGYAWAQSGPSVVSSSGAGAFCWGYAVGGTAGSTSTIQATSQGAFCAGRCQGGSASKTITASGQGSFAQGRVTATTNVGSITASGTGAFCQGNVQGTAAGAGSLSAAGVGAFCQGNANGGAMSASAAGSMAVGQATAGNNITASATNAQQFGPGTNTLANTLQVGSAGLRLKGTTGAPAAPQNGDIWVAAGYVYIRSNGVSCKATNAVM